MRLARCRPAKERFDEKTIWEPNTGCLLWTGAANKLGYGSFSMGIERKRIGAHRAAWIIANGEPAPGQSVLHKCDTPSCVNTEHLYIGSASDNSRDMMSRGRGVFQKSPWKLARGSQHWASKLTESQVAGIVVALNGGASQSSVARSLGVTQSAVNHIVRGRTWRHMNGGS